MTWPSLILHGCGVASPSAAGGFVEAIAVEGDTIVAVGSNGEIDAPCRRSARVVDLAGRLTICAFGDTLVHPSPTVSKACVATCLAYVVARSASTGSAPMRQRCQPTRGCSAVTERWKPFPVGAQGDQPRCGVRPTGLPPQPGPPFYVVNTLQHRLFGHGTVISKPGGAPSIDPRTLQVEVLNRVRFIGTGRSLYDSCGSNPLGRIARA
jgi:hypothetical protein